MIDKFKQQKTLTIASIGLFILGLVFLFAPAGMIQSIIFSVIGITLIVNGILKLITLNTLGANKNELVFPIVTLIIGILVLFNVALLLIVCAVLLLIEPIKNLITTSNFKQQFISQLPRLILPIILVLLCFNSTYIILFVVLGCLLILFSGFIVYTILANKPLVFIVSNNFNTQKDKTNKHRINDDIIDVEEE